MEQIVLVERMIVESLAQEEKNSYELSIDTGLDSVLVTNILARFLKRKYVSFVQGKFYLKQKFFDSRMEYSKKIELRSLFTSILNNFFSKDRTEDHAYLKLKKVWLTEDELNLVNRRMKDLEVFFDEVRARQRMQSYHYNKLATKKVIFWGHCNYKDLALSSLRRV